MFWVCWFEGWVVEVLCNLKCLICRLGDYVCFSTYIRFTSYVIIRHHPYVRNNLIHMLLGILVKLTWQSAQRLKDSLEPIRFCKTQVTRQYLSMIMSLISALLCYGSFVSKSVAAVPGCWTFDLTVVFELSLLTANWHHSLDSLWIPILSVLHIWPHALWQILMYFWLAFFIPDEPDDPRLDQLPIDLTELGSLPDCASHSLAKKVCNLLWRLLWL